MNKLSLAALLLSQSTICTAQTVFTPDNAVPPFGTYEYAWYYEFAAPATPIDTNATSGIWDFSATLIEGAFEYQVTISPASATPFAAASAGADVCWTYNYGWGNDHWYYKNGPDSLTWTANLTDIFDDDVYIGETCRRVQFRYPAAIGDVVIEDVTDCEGPLNGYPKNWQRKVIATGTLITSLGTYTDVILVKDRLSAWNAAADPPFPVLTELYLWYLPNNALEPLATWRADQDLNYLYMRILTPSTVLSEHANTAQLTISADPASDFVTVQSNNGRPIGEMVVVSSDGSIVLTASARTDRTELAVQRLSPGVYTLVCIADGQRSSLRFVRQ